MGISVPSLSQSFRNFHRKWSELQLLALLLSSYMTLVSLFIKILFPYLSNVNIAFEPMIKDFILDFVSPGEVRSLQLRFENMEGKDQTREES